jgi:hypothetical protein
MMVQKECLESSFNSHETCAGRMWMLINNAEAHAVR